MKLGEKTNKQTANGRNKLVKNAERCQVVYMNHTFAIFMGREKISHSVLLLKEPIRGSQRNSRASGLYYQRFCVHDRGGGKDRG